MTVVALTNSISIQFSQTVSEIIFGCIDEKYMLKKEKKREKKREKKGGGERGGGGRTRKKKKKKERFIT